MDKKNEEKVKQIGITIKGEDVRMFNAIKKARHLSVDAATVRVMIREMYEIIKKEKQQ